MSKGKYLRCHGILSEDGRRLTIRYRDRVVDVRVTSRGVQITSVQPDGTAQMTIPIHRGASNGQ
jgi:hypothetical protein